MALTIRFMSLTGKFATVKSEVFPTSALALAAVEAYATAAGFTKVRMLDERCDADCFRFTAVTPGGRGGRNVAFGEEEYDDSCLE